MTNTETTTTPIHPDIEVQLSGRDGNAFAIIAAVMRGMERAGVDQSERDKFKTEAMSGDYDHLLRTAMRYVEVS